MIAKELEKRNLPDILSFRNGKKVKSDVQTNIAFLHLNYLLSYLATTFLILSIGSRRLLIELS